MLIDYGQSVFSLVLELIKRKPKLPSLIFANLATPNFARQNVRNRQITFGKKSTEKVTP
jgi:hypothetical protein